jgi:hypothetical protein
MINLSIPRIDGMIFAVRGNYYDGEDVMAGDTAGFDLKQVKYDSEAIDTYITDITGGPPRHAVVRYTKLVVLDLDKDGKTELDKSRERVGELEELLRSAQWSGMNTWEEAKCPFCGELTSDGHAINCNLIVLGIASRT